MQIIMYRMLLVFLCRLYYHFYWKKFIRHLEKFFQVHNIWDHIFKYIEFYFHFRVLMQNCCRISLFFSLISSVQAESITTAFYSPKLICNLPYRKEKIRGNLIFFFLVNHNFNYDSKTLFKTLKHHLKFLDVDF